MQKVILIRGPSTDEGTFGKIYVGDKRWFSGELPWLDNKNNVSCIPTGQYKCAWTFSHSFRKYTYLLLNVPNRSGVRIHSANYCANEPLRKQLHGCLALGKQECRMDGQKALYLSKVAVSEFEIYLNREPFLLEIR